MCGSLIAFERYFSPEKFEWLPLLELDRSEEGQFRVESISRCEIWKSGNGACRAKRRSVNPRFAIISRELEQRFPCLLKEKS